MGREIKYTCDGSNDCLHGAHIMFSTPVLCVRRGLLLNWTLAQPFSLVTTLPENRFIETGTPHMQQSLVGGVDLSQSTRFVTRHAFRCLNCCCIPSVGEQSSQPRGRGCIRQHLPHSSNTGRHSRLWTALSAGMGTLRAGKVPGVDDSTTRIKCLDQVRSEVRKWMVYGPEVGSACVLSRSTHRRPACGR